jgi:hypothetical protein
MKGQFFMAALFGVLLFSIPACSAMDGQGAALKADSSVVFGYVNVTVLEWQPDLEGAGAGLFTYSSFDFYEFFGEAAGGLSELLGF